MISFRQALFALALAGPSVFADVLYQLDGVTGTVYYDLTNSLCGNNDPFVSDWAETSGINNGIPKCENNAGANAKTLAEIGTNRIVALNEDMVFANLDEWCGKEVKVWDSDGNEVVLDEGPFVVWDSCAACASMPKLDFSAKAFVDIKGGTCGGTNPTGLKFQVMTNNIWQPWSADGTSGGPGSSPSSGDTTTSASSESTSSSSSTPAEMETAPASTAIPSTSAAPTSSALPTSSASPTSSAVESAPTTSSWAWHASASGAAHVTVKPGVKFANLDITETITYAVTSASSSSPSQATNIEMAAFSDSGSPAPSDPVSTSSVSATSTSPSSSDSACTYGAWQCDGTTIQVCSYQTISSLGWETVGECGNSCSVSDSGSIDCS